MIRKDVRDVLRHGGYKPTGRGKPASEYLVKAAAKGLRSINLAVDACNVVSLHSGLPISVVDLDRAAAPLSVAIADADASYVFNASGQEIRLGGLLCLHDAEGPCANAVKDSQRTKTHDGTTRTLSLVWGAKAHAEADRSRRGLVPRTPRARRRDHQPLDPHSCFSLLGLRLRCAGWPAFDAFSSRIEARWRCGSHALARRSGSPPCSPSPSRIAMPVTPRDARPCVSVRRAARRATST